MANQPKGPVLSFKYNDVHRNIRVDDSISLENLLKLVARRWNIVVPISLVYLDSSSGKKTMLDVDDDLPSLITQNYTWIVLTDEPRAVAPGAASGAQVPHIGSAPPPKAGSTPSEAFANVFTGEDDAHDESMGGKKDEWIGFIPDSWECKGQVQKHPFFISYRKASETQVATILFNKIKLALLEDYRGSYLPKESRLSGQHPFWDVECLPFAKKWDINFMSGLYHSSVIILLCSDKGMERMLQADTKPDNCLLEWELALQLKEEMGHDILPVLLSRDVMATIDDGRRSLVTKKFDTFDYNKFPNHVHMHPLSPGSRTVSQTVKTILDLNGPFANPDTDILKIVTAAREVHSRRRAYRQSQTAESRFDLSLSRSSLTELEKWLSPLSEQMDAETQDLLKNVLSGSRQWLLKKVFQFLSPDDPSSASANRVMWLKGVAGVGKSVMAAMVSRELQAQGMLGGLFFCKHDDERRSSARNLVLTLVFGLAKFSIHFGKMLLQVKQSNPDILSRSIFEMMKLLIVQPLSQLADSNLLLVPVVLVVDALDECGTIRKREEFLSVFKELNRLLPANLKMLVTGRPEQDIVNAFEEIPFEEIEPAAEENLQDQINFTEHFLRSTYAPSSVVDEGSRILVSKSSGIFVWLVTACNYLKKSETETITLDEIKALPEGDKMDGSIDKMYSRIFSGILQSVVLEKMKMLLQIVLSIIGLAYEPLTASAIVSLLDMWNEENVKRCIRILDPILVLDGSTMKIRFFHKSVKDFLTSRSRCLITQLQIDPKACHMRFASLCISAMEKNLKFNMCNLPLSDFHSEIPNFEDIVGRHIPEHIKYAVKHFWEHCFDSSVQAGSLDNNMDDVKETNVNVKRISALGLKSSKIPQLKNRRDDAQYLKETPTSSELSPSLLEPAAINNRSSTFAMELSLFSDVKSLLQTHGDHYLEACSLIHSLDMVIPAMSKLQQILPLEEEGRSSVHCLMEDMKRVLQKFIVPLNLSALQVYFTAIPFSPSNSEFYRNFAGKVPPSILVPRLAKGQPRFWPSCISVLEGHTDRVNSTSFSPDGLLVVSGGVDKTIRIWNASTGQELHKLEGHTFEVTSAAFSPDGVHIVSGSTDKTVRIWSATTGRELRVLTGHLERVNSAAISPNAELVVSSSNDCFVIIWNARSGEKLRELKGHSGWVNSAKFSPDGKFVVSGSVDTTVRIWNAATGEQQRLLSGHSDEVTSVAFSPDGQFVVSGGSDKTVRIWNAVTCDNLQTLQGHSDRVNSVSFSLDGQFIVSGSWDKTIRIWNASNGKEAKVLEGHSGRVNFAAFSPNMEIAVSGSAGAPEYSLIGHSDRVHSVTFSHDGQFVVSGSSDRTVRIWNASADKDLHDLDGHSGEVKSAVVSPDGKLVATGSTDRTVRIWDSINGDELHKLQGHSDTIETVAFSLDGQYIVSGSWDKTVRTWHALTGQEIRNLEGHTDWVICVAFSPDGQMIASGGADRTVQIWNASTGEVKHRLEGYSDWVKSVAFSPSGQLIATGSWDMTVQIWSTTSGELLHKLVAKHISMVESVAFSPDESFVVSGSADTTVCIWSTSLGQLVHVMKDCSFSTTSAFSPDGRFLVLNETNGKRELWNLATLESEAVMESSESDRLVLQHHFCGRNIFGEKLQSGTVLHSLVTASKAVWFLDTDSGASCWLPIDLRGNIHLLFKKSILVLGNGVCCLIQF